MSGWASMSIASVSRMVTLSSTASTRMGFGCRSGKRHSRGSTGQRRGIHADVNGIAEQSTDQRRQTMKPIRSADSDVGQRIDRLGGGGQRQRSGVESNRQIGTGLDRGGSPASFAHVHRAIPAGLAGGVGHDRVGQVGARQVERSQHQQHEHGDGQGEFDERLGRSSHESFTNCTRRAREPGQVLVIFAITVVSILTMVGLLYSFVLVLSQRRALQTAADASSLSGAWQVVLELASDNRSDSAVVSAIVQFATTNGVPSDGTAADASYISALYVDSSGASLTPVGGGGAFPVTARGVRVTVKNQVPTILPGFLNVWQVLVQDSASSVAKPTAPPAAANAAIPVGVLASDVQGAYSAHTT